LRVAFDHYFQCFGGVGRERIEEILERYLPAFFLAVQAGFFRPLFG
jgi:hypothetical protein